jgi:hypothetical protein
MTVSARQDLVKTFTIDYVSDIDDTRYVGNFTIKKLSIRDLASLGVRKAQLNGGMYYDGNNPGRGVDESTDDFNNMLAHLELSVKSAPTWWDMDKINDINLLSKIFREVLEFENSFLRRVADRAADNGNSPAGSTGNISQTNNSGVAQPVVGSEVQAALEP